MDNFDVLIAQATIAQRQRELEGVSKSGLPERAQAHRGVRHSLASTLVRAGLRLDPEAGEGLSAFDVRTAGQEGGC